MGDAFLLSSLTSSFMVEGGNGNLIWSPISNTNTFSLNDSDWINSYGLPGLPSSGLPSVTLTKIVQANSVNQMASSLEAAREILEKMRELFR